MRWSLTSAAAVLALAVTLTACSRDVATAPKAAPQFKITVDNMAPDSTSADFTVSPSGGVFAIGPHAIFFPPRAICNPATSSYGIGTWNAPCEPLMNDIRLHAEVRSVSGLAYVDFTPALRFVPSSNPMQWVIIAMRSPKNDPTFATKSWKLLWAPSAHATPIDESLSDPTLRTWVSLATGAVYRRIKHFSSYQLALGFADTPADTTAIGGL